MTYNIRCGKCGHEFEVEKWHPGMECPECQATDTVPMGKVGEPEPGEQKLSRAEDKRRAAAPGWKSSRVVAGIAIVVIVLTWIGLIFWKFNKPKASRVEVWAMCTECGERIKKFTDEVPCDCPKCGKKKTVYTCYECMGKKGKECGYVFAFVPPPSLPSPRDRYRDAEKLKKMSQEERNKAMREADTSMMEHEQAQREAMRCPKCGSYNTGPVYTEEQKKKFEELKKKYAKRK